MNISELVAALDLPAGARLDRRVPKKLLLENGAPTAADKRAIQDGIDELQWIAALKPNTIGVPLFSDATREYLEIAVVAVAVRPGAKSNRLIELIHRSIPYPVFLITSDADGLVVSVAHKRHAPNDAGKVVIERVVSAAGIKEDLKSPHEQAFTASLALARQPRGDLFTLYEGMLARIEALNAARLNGAFVAADDPGSIKRRRDALDAHFKLTCEIARLRAKAAREKQMNRRVVLNLEIQRLEADLAMHKKNL